MSIIIQWAIIAAALAASIWFLARKLRKEASGKCDGCCERCKLHTDLTDCTDFKPDSSK